MRRRLVKLTDYSCIREGRDFDDVSMALYGMKKGRGNKKRSAAQLTRWDTCRETISNYIREAWTPYGGRNSFKPDELCRDLTRVLFLFAKKSVSQEHVFKRSSEMIERGVKLLNIFEKEAGWKLSYPFIVPLKDKSLSTAVYAVEGPRKWKQSPYLLSAFLLLVRAGRFETFDNVKTYKSFVKKCEKLGELYLERKTSPLEKWPSAKWVPDIHHLYDNAYKMLPFIKNLNKIFEGRHEKDLYGRSHFSDGFNNLCKCKNVDKRVRVAFREMCEENKLEPKKTLRALDDIVKAKEAEERRKKNQKVLKKFMISNKRAKEIAKLAKRHSTNG